MTTASSTGARRCCSSSPSRRRWRIRRASSWKSDDDRGRDREAPRPADQRGAEPRGICARQGSAPGDWPGQRPYHQPAAPHAERQLDRWRVRRSRAAYRRRELDLAHGLRLRAAVRRLHAVRIHRPLDLRAAGRRLRNRMANSFDVVVIGGGPGGYVAAIRAAQLGLTTACIDDWRGADGKPALGGTCTNVGCIPSKALLQSSEYYEQAGHQFADHGVKVKGLDLDLAQMLKRKDKVVKASNDGVAYLFKKNKIQFFHGRGAFAKAGGDGYEIQAGKETLSARHVIVATGSNPRALPGVEFDEKLILSNTGALAIPEVPKRLGVIGAGVIGLEMGSVWRRLGAEVTILEALPAFLGAADETIAKEAAKIFARQGLAIELGVKISKVSGSKKVFSVQYTAADSSSKTLEGDRLIVSIGRLPNTEGLNAA